LRSSEYAVIFARVSTLKEIEAAVENLPQNQLEELLTFVAERISRPKAAAAGDPFDAVIGAFAGPCDATGRKAEEILYGNNS
jgi:hypothetical protein